MLNKMYINVTALGSVLNVNIDSFNKAAVRGKPTIVESLSYLSEICFVREISQIDTKSVIKSEM